MDKKNLLKYNLKKDDVLYFQHIPKTAGTSFIFHLENYFNLSEILTAQSWSQISKNISEDFSKYKLVKGHFGNAIHQIIPKNIVYITMLRNPSNVIISYLRMLKRLPVGKRRWKISEDETISNLILRQNITGVNNPHCLWLNFNLDIKSLTKGFDQKLLHNFLPEDKKGFMLTQLPPEKILENAKQHLLKCKFFGIVERFEDSLMLLNYTFGWRPSRYLKKLNTAPDNSLEELSSEAKVELAKKTKLDTELYKFAQQLFDVRYSQMINHLKENYYEPRFNNMNASDIIYEMLEKDYQDNFLKSRYPSSSINYTFEQKIDGTGWHQREINQLNKKLFRWTGPETHTTIDFALNTHNDMKVQFHIIDSIDPNILKSLKLLVNGNHCKLKFYHIKIHKKSAKFEGNIPKSWLIEHGNLCRLTFQINQTITPKSIKPNSTDLRQLGIAIDWIKIM